MFYSLIVRMHFAIILFLIVICSGSFAQDTSNSFFSKPVPLYPKLLEKLLPNGLKYYVLENSKPAGKVVMCLSVHVGTLQEKPGEVELAHLLEHMAYNGSKHASDGWDYLGRLGIQMGVDGNAYTGYDQTCYWITVPNEPEKVRAALQLLRDFAHDLSLNPEAIDSERGVVIAELRRGAGYSQRMMEQYYPWLIRGTRYAKHFHSTEARNNNLRAFDSRLLMNFYRHWYRPDLQNVIIVGDMDSSQMVLEVERFFSDIPRPSSPIEITTEKNDLKIDNGFLTVVDSEMPNIEFHIYEKRATYAIKTVGDLRTFVIEQLYNELVKQRLVRATGQYNLPCRVFKHETNHKSLPDFDVLHTYVEPKPGRLKESVQFAMTEIKRMRHYGFSENELKSARFSLLSSDIFRIRYDSKALLNEISSFAVGGDVVSDYNGGKMLLDFLREVNIEDLNKKISEWTINSSTDILILAPKSELPNLPGKADIELWTNEVKNSSVLNTYVNDSIKFPYSLKGKVPPVGKRKGNLDVKTGISEFRLRNGARIYFKPISSGTHPGQINIYAFSPGGISQYSEGQRLNAAYATDIVLNSGVGDLNKFQLKELLGRTTVTLTPYIHFSGQGFTGSAKKPDFETLMKLVYLYFTDVRKDTLAFKDWKEEQMLAINFSENDVNQVMDNWVDSMLCKEALRPAVNFSNLNSIDINKVYDIYRDRFSRVQDFVFIIIGDFDVNELSETASRYIGAISKNSVKVAPVRSSQSELCASHSRINIGYFGVGSDKSNVRILYRGMEPEITKKSADLHTLNRALSILLTERLREKEEGTYAVISQVNCRDGVYSFQIDFDCSPLRYESLISAAIAEIDRLKKYGMSDDFFRRVIESERNDAQDNVKSVLFWQDYILKIKVNRDSDFGDRGLIMKMTKEDIQRAATKYLVDDRCIQFILLPECYRRAAK